MPSTPAANPLKASLLKYLNAQGEGFDADIAKALKAPLGDVRTLVAALAVSGDVICCKVTRYIDGKMIEGVSCRLSGTVPRPAPGPKPGGKIPSA